RTWPRCSARPANSSPCGRKSTLSPMPRPPRSVLRGAERRAGMCQGPSPIMARGFLFQDRPTITRCSVTLLSPLASRFPLLPFSAFCLPIIFIGKPIFTSGGPKAKHLRLPVIQSPVFLLLAHRACRLPHRLLLPNERIVHSKVTPHFPKTEQKR